MNEIGIIGVPSSAGARHTGQELAPSALRKAGLTERLQSAGHVVNDFGDLPEISYLPDQQNPKCQNLNLVLDVAKGVARKVEEVVSENALPFILGGDCSIALGVVAGLINSHPSLGLLYFDGDLDLNTPDTTISGILDGMVMAHLIGKGDEKLAHLGPRYPLMAEENITLFGYNAEAGAIDPIEAEVVKQTQMLKYPVSGIRGKAKEMASEALRLLENKAESILVHFDVDVIDYADFPVGDLPHYHGLSFDEAISALEIFMTSPKFSALAITEFNANRDEDGSQAQRLVDAIAKALP